MTKKTYLAAPLLVLLAACGGSSDGSATNPTTTPLPIFTVQPVESSEIIVSNDNGSGLARINKNGSSRVRYSSTMTQESLQDSLQSISNINQDTMVITDNNDGTFSADGTFVSNGVDTYLFLYGYDLGGEDAAVVGISRNNLIDGGELVQAYGSNVTGVVPAGDLIYRGYALVASADQTFIDSGNFTMRVNFNTGRGAISGSGDAVFIESNNLSIDNRNGTFSSGDVDVGVINGATVNGFIEGNFHGESAIGVTGIFGDDNFEYVGGIVGSR